MGFSICLSVCLSILFSGSLALIYYLVLLEIGEYF